MNCPGKDCPAELHDGEVACPTCMKLIAPGIRSYIAYWFKRGKTEPRYAKLYSALVDSTRRLLAEGVT